MGAFVWATLFVAFAPAQTAAQSIKDVAGTYTLVSETREQDGVKTDLPTKGSLSLDASGRYMLTTVQPNLPKIASNNRMTATPEENKAIVSGIVAHFGTYSIDGNNLVFDNKEDAEAEAADCQDGIVIEL